MTKTQEFKMLQYWKHQWTKNATNNGGAMKKTIDNADDGDVIIHSMTKRLGRMWGSCTPKELIKLTTKNHGIQEVITKFPHKVYFDIDQKGKEESLLEKVKTQIHQYFPNARMAISGSITDEKTSYHIVLPQYTIQNEEDRSKMKIICRTLGEPFDKAVYTTNRNMKCINQSKPDGRVQEIIEDEKEKHHLITCYLPSKPLSINFDLPEEQIELKKLKQPFDLSEYKAMNLKVSDSFNLDTQAVNLLSLAPGGQEYDFKYDHFIARFSYHNKISFEKFWDFAKQKEDSEHHMKKWYGHWKKLVNFPPVSKQYFIKVMARFYPDIDKDMSFRNFKSMLDIPKHKNITIKTIGRLNQKHFTCDEKYIVNYLGMGSGKTTQSISYLRGKNFAWITGRRSLVKDTYPKMKKNGIKKVTNYLEIKSVTKKLEELPHSKRLFISPESLHYIQDKTFDVIVIDEIESVLNSWTSSTHSNKNGDFRAENWAIWKNLLRSAKKVIFLDAFITSKTLNHILQVDPEEKIIINCSENKNVSRDVLMLSGKFTYYDWLNRIEKDLKKNKRLYIFYPFKSGYKDYPSMEGLKKKFEMLGKKVIAYHADNGKNTEKTLEDVNKHWLNYDVILTNSKITIGVSFDQEHFDKVYLGIASYNLARDIIQSSYRCRNLKEQSITVVNFPGQKRPILNDFQKMDLDFQCLLKDWKKEHLAPVEKSFKLFCHEANYNFQKIEVKCTEIVKTYYKNFFNKYDVTFKYENINDLEPMQVHAIQKDIFCDRATMEDKLALHKYMFKKLFISETPNDVIQDAWNSKKQVFFSNYRVLKHNKQGIINPILLEMKIKLPKINLEKVYFSESIRDKIRKQIIGRYDYTTASDSKLLALLLNSYLNMDVVKYKNYNASKSKNGKWVISNTFLKYSKQADKFLYIKQCNDHSLDIETEHELEIGSDIDFGVNV